MAQAREPAETERRSRPALPSRLGSPRIPGPSSVDSPLSAAAVLHLQRVAGNRAAAERVQARDGERRVQRLTVASTRWNDATSARLTTSGSVGAAIVEEANAPSVVVKANEPMTDELAIATNLANAVGSSKKYPFSAPEVRTAGAEESDVIAAMLTRTFPSGSSEKVRQDTFVTKLRNPTTVIFAYAPGKDYDQIVAEASRPRTSLTKTLTFRSESARWADALVDPDYYQALGRVTALDIFLYNRDRVVNANTGNWRVDLDANSVSLIDNVFKSGLGSVLTDTRSEGRARAGLGAWWGWDLAQKLCSAASPRSPKRWSRISTSPGYATRWRRRRRNGKPRASPRFGSGRSRNARPRSRQD